MDVHDIYIYSEYPSDPKCRFTMKHVYCTLRHRRRCHFTTSFFMKHFSGFLAGQCSVPSGQCFMSWEARGFVPILSTATFEF